MGVPVEHHEEFSPARAGGGGPRCRRTFRWFLRTLHNCRRRACRSETRARRSGRLRKNRVREHTTWFCRQTCRGAQAFRTHRCLAGGGRQCAGQCAGHGVLESGRAGARRRQRPGGNRAGAGALIQRTNNGHPIFPWTTARVTSGTTRVISSSTPRSDRSRCYSRPRLARQARHFPPVDVVRARRIYVAKFIGAK